MMSTTEQPAPFLSSTRIRFLGSRSADSTTMEEVMARIEAAVNSKTAHLVVAVNVPKLWRMERDDKLRSIIEQADLVLPEPMVVLTSRLTGKPLRACIGNDQLTHRLLPAAAERGYRVFFLGTHAEALQRLQSCALAQHPGLLIAGSRDGFFSATEAEAVAQQIRAAHPDILFVGMGTPRQEYWMHEWGRQLGVPVVIGVGGTLDVLAGLKSHCPNWIRTAGLEWLYRMLEDPRGKATRYLRTLPWFVWVLLTEGLLPRLSGWNAGNE